ncbi:MAG TPA: FecR family protein [bacterium]
MKRKIVLPLLVSMTLMLDASFATSQYLPRATSPGAMADAARQVAEESSDGLGLAFVTYLDGNALLRSTDDEDWAAVAPNLSLRVGDRIWVQDGARTEVRFPLGATAWVNYQSELDITRMLRGSRADTIQLALVSGEAAFDVTGFDRPGSVVQVDLPSASIRAFRAARFRVNTLPDGTAQIGVVSGTLALETTDGITDVSAGRMAELRPDGRVLLDFLPSPDDWDTWIASRADRYDQPAASGRYLPADLSPYAHEFDSSGRWVSDQTYGYVWVPAVDPGWSPYSNGRWVWQANDYVWLSYDPWYAPFHFGRWNWSVSFGWFWVAPRGRAYWSPGYVGWSILGDDVCWVPLGYNEVYYGYGNYGPGSVNVYKTTNINITNVYVNSTVNNGVVVVQRDNFLRGKIRQGRIAPARNPFQRGGGGDLRVIGRAPIPEIKPIRETRQPRPDIQITRTSLPPARLDKQARDIKMRVVAPTRDKSAFQPGRKPPAHRNVVKEKELEQWAPPPKAPPAARPEPAFTKPARPPAQRPAQYPAPPPARPEPGFTRPAPPAARPEPGFTRPASPPARPEPGFTRPEPPAARPEPGFTRPEPPAAAVREPQPPAGRHQFKRVPEPQGGAIAPPELPTVPPGPRRKGEQERQQLPGDERQRGGGRGPGSAE